MYMEEKVRTTSEMILKNEEVQQEGTRINRKYKDTLFRMIFQEKKNLLELYNALHNTSYINEEELKIVTLENAIYMNMKNDVAYLMVGYLNMFEHQSTKNPNMPLRDLLYIAREYEKLIDKQSLYFSSKIKIPAPRFVVFYNGTEECLEKQTLKLSDLYFSQEENPALELKVQILNINRGYNCEIMQQCRALREYMQYIEKVRHYVEKMPIEQAVDCAVTECIKEGILAEFLEKYRREAIQVSIFEYDEERELRLIRQDERRQGIEIGEENKLRMQIAKKQNKGKTISQIAQELEESEEVIQSLI